LDFLEVESVLRIAVPLRGAQKKMVLNILGRAGKIG
jgi:hypothetical protein